MNELARTGSMRRLNEIIYIIIKSYKICITYMAYDCRKLLLFV